MDIIVLVFFSYGEKRKKVVSLGASNANVWSKGVGMGEGDTGNLAGIGRRRERLSGTGEKGKH